ncbi:DUF4389 domain-containing protein [Actibacterium lipolyticum]|uniref:DUF4389 domain-containing protein n=1 Tax=Actibacterium lipolyticum TaxID=1524263 RepID=A0A238JTP9_9RHOB|nr:DUF4389 domain-containing protein [Actibacterium lipolyticum]SMX33567.1 hypothetical protein COL8621_01051 [Actibacterium lipolyticum]
MNDETIPPEDEPVPLTEESKPPEYAKRDGIWLRGLWMIILAILFAVAETILWVCALVQFGWLLFTKERNQFIVDFGKQLGSWLTKTAEFQTGVSEEKPFPWTAWK